MLTGRDGTPREVDVLIEWKFAEVSFKMAVECRDYTRQQSIEWVDALIGKYVDLNVNKIVAVSSSKFYIGARNKAKAHGIEVITVNEALTKDWRAEIERWKMMTHSFTLMRISTVKSDGEVFTYSEISPDGETATHRDELSEHMHNLLKPMFMAQLSRHVGTMLEAKIRENWQHFCSDTTPRWAEFVIPNPGIQHHGVPLGIDKIVFGVGTFFHVGSPENHVALKEHALSTVVIKKMKEDAILRFVFDRNARPITIGFGDDKPFRIRPTS
jgi:Restriction endonuclease